jgi:hypothetical protein
LNLSLKVWFEKSLKKKKKEKTYLLPFRLGGPAAHQPSPRGSPRSRLLFFSFCFADERAPPVSPSPVAFLSSSPPSASPGPALPQISPRPAAFPFLSSSPEPSN